ncbi:ATP synthase subunit g, mitochondrial [Drosophila grimshawi]|uniref:ATP synthase subunit g n=1 Tax=Drosophila grimshawi TaxID=7222 RepID=B4JDW0_DROGR|nr:ATP synthase subunit g, mitochondrial [Drosophila grimshawi]EDW03480.1 GH11258 [Drosophila grimshawi]
MSNLMGKATALLNKFKAQARPQFDEFMRYAKVELTPPTPADFQHLRKTAKKAKKDVKGTRSRLGRVTVAEAWLNTLVTIEVITWFFMGEVIGRRHFVGYKV